MDIFPIHIRACIFILIAFVIATTFQYVLLRPQVFSLKRATLWASITGVTFVSGNIWILVLFIVFVSGYIMPKKGNMRVAYYFLLLPIIPPLAYEIPGLPGIRYLFYLTYPRILTLIILLPLFVKYINQPKTSRDKLLSGPVDKLVVVYVLLLSVLAFRDTTLTNALRMDFMYFLDIILPYFVISRYVNSTEDIQQVFIAILYSAIMLAFVAILEIKFGWDFYRYLRDLLNFEAARGSRALILRGGNLRISATMTPIPFGYFLALSLGVYLYLKDRFSFQIATSITTIILILVPLYYTGSRGAWLTAIIVVTVYSFLKIRSLHQKMGITLLVLFGLFGLALTQTTPIYVDETGTFEYRKRLISSSISVIMDNFFFGSTRPREIGALEQLRQGQGIIDLVNTYISVALHYGVIGLVFFGSIFFVTILQLYKKTNQYLRTQIKNEHKLGAALTALVLGTIVLIGTVSSVNFTPIYYWAIIALSSAYIRILPRKPDGN